jgi:hypothetical protein
MGYNLTDKQKDLLRWMVQQVRAGNLPEEFYVVWAMEGGLISGFVGKHPVITRGALDALANAGLLLCAGNFETTTSVSGSKTRPSTSHRQREMNRRCTITAKAFEAVDSDFELPPQQASQITIGAIVRNMSGGTVQAVGIAQDADISQIVNDPSLLRSHVEALAENLLNEVKPSLNVDELAEYAKALRDLKEELVRKQPEPPVIRRLVRTVGLLGDIEGTVGLMTRVWTLLYPLLLIAAARLT